MTAGWVAPVVRGGCLLRRTVGSAAAIAGASEWGVARDALGATPYGRALPPDADRRTARVVAENGAAWQIRVLAGWLPPGGAALARLAVAPFEIANVDRHLRHLGGGRDVPPVDLGTLAAVWPRVERTTDADDVREVLRRSTWGDPGGSERTAIALGLRVAWARRTMRLDAAFRPWALGGLAVLVARERFVFDRPINEPTARSIDRSLGPRWRTASDVIELTELLPEPARWPLRDIADHTDLWRSEVALLDRIERDATALVASQRPSRTTFVAILARLLVDTWRVTAAIELAGRPAIDEEVFRGVAS